MISRFTLNKIGEAIYKQNELYGCIVGFHGNLNSIVMNAGVGNSPNYNKMVIVEEVVDLGEIDLPKESFETKQLSPSETKKILNETVVGSELLGTTLSCGLAVISGVGVIGSAAAELPSVGASTVTLVLAWTGFVSGGIQCVNGIMRSIESIRNPQDNSLQRWDSNGWYSNIILLVDVAGLASGGYGIYKNASKVKTILRLRGALASESQLAAMSQEGRIAAMEKALEKVSHDKAAAMELDAAIKEMKSVNGARFNPPINATQMYAHIQVADANLKIATKMISQNGTKALSKEIGEIVAGIAGYGLSATPSTLTGSGSGAINGIIVHIL